MKSGSIYLVVRNFEKSLAFYEKILDMPVSARNGSRFAIFNYNGLNLCILNGYYDAENTDKVTRCGEYFGDYDDCRQIAESENTRKIFVNLGVDDLKQEYERIQSLGIAADLTPIRYLCVFSPYWYFVFKDPDGNPIEVTGPYDAQVQQYST